MVMLKFDVTGSVERKVEILLHLLPSGEKRILESDRSKQVSATNMACLE